MIQTTLYENKINWDKIDYHKEVINLMYPDGFHKTRNHGLWKLKIKLTKEEWEKIKHLFQFYTKTKDYGETIIHMKYYGWATTEPVEVMKIIYTLRNHKKMRV